MNGIENYPQKIFLESGGAAEDEIVWTEKTSDGLAAVYIRKDVMINAMKTMRNLACQLVGQCMAKEKIDHSDLVELQVDIHDILLEGFELKKTT